MELDAWLAEDNTSEETKKAYRYFMRPEPRDIVSDLETDPETGLRSRLMRIGMVRGAKDEDKKTVRVYLDPLPHIRIPEGKPLQAWYKSKIEEPGTRNRPCLLPDALVDTPFGPRRIADLRPGDIVFGYDLENDRYAETYVQGIASQKKSEYLEIEIENGRTLRLTPEHLVYTRNRGWVEAETLTMEDDLVSLLPTSPIERVKASRRVSEETTVHDIQTSTENFFAEGVLVHNCFTEAILTSPYGGFCAVGCAFAVYSGEWIDSPTGPKRVDEIRVGDTIWGRAPEGIVPNRVTAKIAKWSPEGIEVTLSSGQRIRVNGEHPVWAPGRGGWIEARDLRPGYEVESFSEDLILQGVRSVDRASNGDVLLSLSNRSFEGGVSFEPSSSTETPETLRSVRRSASRSQEEVLRPLFVRGPVGIHTGERAGFSGSETVLLWGYDSEESETLRRVSRDASENRSARQHERSRSSGTEKINRTSNLHRGEGVLETGGTGESRSIRGGVGHSRLGDSGVESSRPTFVVSVRAVPAGNVYDLETATENYYLKGAETPEAPALLVHNCYVNSGFKGYRGTGLISVPENYGAFVRKSLKKMRTSAAGYFSSFTDPFLSLEDVYHNTQEGAQAFVDEGLPIFFLSRRPYPSWAFDLLKKSPYSYAQKSINTPDPKDWKKLSPGAASLEHHLGEIRELRKAGIYVSIQLNPVLPGVVDHEGVERLIGMLAEAGANHVIVKFVEAGYSWAPAMVERVKKRFPGERSEKFAELFTENIGGQRTIVEEYRLEGHRRYARAARENGLTYATCYEYRMERDATGRVVNKTGVSIGKEFLSAAQCHGPRVPMFTRRGADSPFEEVEECPPTGCLSCADDNDGKARCGSELFGAAKALRAPDFRVGVYDAPPVAGETKRRRSLPVVGGGSFSGPSARELSAAEPVERPLDVPVEVSIESVLGILPGEPTE